MNDSEITRIEAAIKELDFDYMRGLVAEGDYQRQMTDLRAQLEAAGGTVASIPSIKKIEAAEIKAAHLQPPPSGKKAMVDPVTAVERTVQSMRRIPIERIAQEAGVPAPSVSKILTDLLDGREISGRVDHDSGDFILGTGTGPAPKTVHGCPYCRADISRVAVRGETVTCSVCRESFIVS